MIKRIKRRIFIATMGSVLIVLLFFASVLNVTNYGSILRETDAVFSVLASNQGTFPEYFEVLDEINPQYAFRELPYEIRYFSVEVDKNGDIVKSNTSHISSAQREHTADLIAEAVQQRDQTGFIDKYRFRKELQPDGSVLIMFIDVSRSLASYEDTLKNSILYGCLGYLIVLALSFFLSKEAVATHEVADRKQKEFIANAGHEIKTPIAIISADAQALSIDIGENEWCEDILHQADRLTKLTTDLITLSRTDAKKKKSKNEEKRELTSSAADTKEMLSPRDVEEHLHSFASIAQLHGKQYSYQVQEKLSFYINKKELEELLDILLDNAVKYSSNQAVICARIWQEGRELRVQVENDVPEHLPEHITEEMFDRFYRGDKSHNQEIPGSGIGLSVAKAICESSGGNITAKIQKKQMVITAVLR